jgi:hypothetical protein
MRKTSKELFYQKGSRLQRWLWRRRVRRAWKQGDGDIGQFLGNVGYERARGFLPHDILEQNFSV